MGRGHVLGSRSVQCEQRLGCSERLGVPAARLVGACEGPERQRRVRAAGLCLEKRQHVGSTGRRLRLGGADELWIAR